MSFLIRSRPSQKWGRSGSSPASASFSVRTGRRVSGEPDGVMLRSGAEPVRDCLAAAHFLRNETQAARTAVEALDSYILKLASFQDKALEVIEEAHRALSRLERAVALSAAPELIVVACEIKVACHRGLHLFRTYGKYRYLGKVIALATRSSITAKFDGVIGRLTAIMPLDRTPSFISIKPMQAAAAAALQPGYDIASGAQQGSGQRSTRPSLEEAAGAQQQQQQQTVSSSNGGYAAAGSPGGRLRGANRSSDAAVGSVVQTHGAAEGADTSAVLSVVLRSSEAAKVTCISFVDLPGASTCVWWAAGDRLEFYSTSTQSTTSFAPYTERAAITAVAVDSVGNVWCANSKGAVMMRQQRNWEQVFVEHAFSSCVRCLATDADSDVMWAGDEAGRLAVFRFVEEGGSCKLECTATIMPGRADLGMKSNSSSALLDVKPKTLSRWHTLSCMRLKDQQGVAEGPIRAMLVRDDRAWVGGGRTDPWIGLFDAVLGTQLDMWSCNQYGSCLAMASMLTSDALADSNAAAATAAAAARFQPPRNSSEYGSPGLDVPTSVPEDNIGEDPRSGWRLITGHESGQLLLWNAASDRLQPLIKIGDTGLSPVRSLSVMEEQGLLAVVHANGELAMFLRPSRDRDWLMGPTTAAAAAAAAAGCSMDGAASGVSGAGATAGVSAGGSASGQGGEQLSPATSSGAVADRGRSGGGSAAAAAGLTTIKPRRVVLRSHRSMLVAAAACSSGVVTASALGSIKLWPATGLGKEAERCGLLPLPVPMQATRESSLTARSAGSLNRNQQQPMTRQNSDSMVSNARSPPGSGCSAAADSAAEAAAGAAAWHMPGEFAQQANQQGILQQQQQQQQRDLQQEHAAMVAWQQQMHPQDSISHPHQQLYGMTGFAQSPQQQQLQADVSLARLSDPGLQWLQQQSQQALFLNGPEGAAGAGLPEQIGNPLIQEQQLPLERRSAPLDIPWQANMVAQQSAAAGSGRATGMGTAMYARLTAQHQLGQLGGSPRFSGALLSDALAGTSRTPSAAGSMLGESPRGGFQAPHGPPSALDVPLDSGPRYAAPRAPKALRERELSNRERRRSERRLSKGANIAWSTCQIINASELRMLECIGGGAYGQVFLAEWMGTQVAAKQLLSFQNKAKDEVTKRKANAAHVAKHDFSRDHHDSDSDSDTDSVDSVEEEVAAELKQLMDEVWVLGSLSHPSITRFCALCLDPPMIVMQYYPHGSLYDLLKRGRRGEKRALHELNWAKRLDMLRDIASGMVFLHSRKPPIVHGDLRSPNLLLDLTIDRDRPRFHVKIADFGLARMVGPTSSIAVSKVTNPRWSAPEVLRNSVVSLSADVFSFAVVMWEILTWQQPYEDMMSVQVLFSVMQNFRPEIPPEDELPGKPGPTLPRYLALMERCWAEDEHARPTFEEVLAELDDLRSCESGHARLRGGESQRSLHGSTRVSYSEAPGTPTGSCLGGGSSLAASAPGSNISSAPNSGRECGPIALAAAAAAGAAAEAAASAICRRRSTDAGSVLACDRCRGAASSDPGTPTGRGMFGGGGSSSTPGRMQVVGGSAPTSGSSTSSGSSNGTRRGSTSSPGALGGQNELSFAMPRPPALSGVAAASALGVAPGPASPGAPARTPSRLGPTRMPSTMGSPTAMTYGMAVRHEAEPVAERGAADMAGGGRTYQRRNSGGQPGVSVPGPQLSLAHNGSRLRRLSWGTLEGSLQSGSSNKLGLQPSRASWGGGSIVHEYFPVSPERAGDRPYSPFSAMQACEGSAACEPGLFVASDAGAAAAAEAQRPACPNASLYVNPFGAVQAQAGRQDSLQQLSGPGAGVQVTSSAMYRAASVQQPAPAVPAAAATSPKARVRPPSPFAAVQQDEDLPAVVSGGPLAVVAGIAQQSQRPCSPFAAAQRMSTGDDTMSSSVGQSRVPSSPLMGSRQATDDSVAGAQPPARPCSPTQAAAEPFLASSVAAAAVGPHHPHQHRAANPFAAVQEEAPAAAAPGVSSAAQHPSAGAAARPTSPFAAAQQLQQLGSVDLRVESLSGSPFGGMGAYIGPQSSDGSSQGSSPVAYAPAAAGAHRPTRFGQSPAGGQAQGAAGSSQQADWSQQQQQAPVGDQPWRPPSPFAAVQAAAVQGPIVAQQAKAVLCRLNSQAVHSHSSDTMDAVPQGHQQQQQGISADAGAALPALQSCPGSPKSPSGMRSPLQSFAFVDKGQHSKLQAQRLAAVAAAGAADFDSGSGDLGPSCDSITFPSSLGGTGSVVFLQGLPKRPQPRQ